MNVLHISNISCHKLVALFICGLLTACGGGGGGGSTPNSTSVSISATAHTTAQSLTVGMAMSSFSPVTPSGGATPYTYSYAGTLPDGLILNPSSGVVTGTPTATYATANVVFSVQDAKGVAANTSSAVSFTVGAASLSISATATTTAQSLTFGTAMSSFSPLTPSGGATPYFYSISSGTLPAGLSLDTTTGAVTGTPTATYTAANVVFSVKDASNVLASTSSTVSFSVVAAPVSISATATTTSAQNLTVGTALASFTPLTASGGATPYVYSITSGTLPTGLSLNTTTGAVTGTPGAAYASANVVFSVKDHNNGVASTSSTVSFGVVAATPSISATATTTAQSLTVNTAMSNFTPLAPSGGATPYVYSIKSGTLPAGLSLNTSTGTVSGTPTATYLAATVVFSVKDANNVVAGTTSSVSFTVGAASPAISATATTTAQNLTVGTAMASFSPLTTSGGTAPYTYSITSGALPAGLNLNASSGAVTGTPTTPSAAANVVFSVKDAKNAVANTTSTMSFTVVAAPVSISATATATAQNLTVGTAMASFTPLTPSGGATPYVYSITSGTLPAGLSLNANSGAVTGTPSAPYTAKNVVFSVKDANNGVAGTSSSVSFTVVAAPIAISATASTTAQNLTVNTAMASFTPLTASGSATPYAYSIKSGTLPAGLSLNTSTGAVTGTPSVVYPAATVVFSVKDANNVVAITTSSVSFTVGSAVPSTGWANVKFGGGGYVPGLIFHPTVPNILYARTDVAGAYRWDNANSKWIPITDMFGFNEGQFQGVESIALDPTDANKVYLVGGMYVNGGNARLYTSLNKGATWTYVNLPFPAGGNNAGRAIGERLMVDPNKPSVLFYATRSQGLWKSIDSGTTWNQVTGLSTYKMTSEPNGGDIGSVGNSPIGIEGVVFDTAVPTGFQSSGNATQTIYVTVAPDYKGMAGLSSYLYKSTDGGTTWTGISIPSAVVTDSALYIPHIVRDMDTNSTSRKLYLDFVGQSGPGAYGTGWAYLYSFDGNSTWTQLKTGPWQGAGLGGLSVVGSGASTVIALGVTSTWGLNLPRVYYSTNAGTNWVDIAQNKTDWGWVDDVEIDPFNTSRVLHVFGGGVWATSNANLGLNSTWISTVDGIEELATRTLMTPPAGASYLFVAGYWDVGTQVHTNLDTKPTTNFPGNISFGNGNGADMAWAHPAYIAAIGSTNGNSGNTSKVGVYSTDSGVNWTAFATQPPFAPSGANVDQGSSGEANIAVMAQNKLVWAPSAFNGNGTPSGVPYYTIDNGVTWTATDLPPPTQTTVNSAYHLAADRKNPNKVYAYDSGGANWTSTRGKFYYSTNGGKNFTKSTDPTIAGVNWHQFTTTWLAVNPNAEGDVWLADGDNVYHSTDSGVSWTKLSNMASTPAGYNQWGAPSLYGAQRIALGKPVAGSSYSAAVYLVGTVGSVAGLYRSDNAGATWIRINDDAHQWGGVGALAADNNVAGRVYLAARGVLYNY